MNAVSGKLSHAFVQLVILLYEKIYYSWYLLLIRDSIVHCFGGFCSILRKKPKKSVSEILEKSL